MVFSSTTFLFLFLPILLILYYLPFWKRKQHFDRIWKNTILFLFSIFFYAWGEPVFVIVMLMAIVINWFLAIVMSNSGKHKKAWLVVATGFDILLLAVFKYAGFLSENLAGITGNRSTIISIALPIGISFFTFQIMSYVFDVYYGKVKVQKNLFYVALYVSLFPQLVAGPIVRYSDVEKEIQVRTENKADFSDGVRRFIYGLAKKVLVANYMAQVADNVFDGLTGVSVMLAWLGAVAYTLQIYFDFSGYSDMAIGLGKMFGFHFLENFNYPYIANSVTDFWRRWHISLSSWFRDYVYIPLGGNRVSKSRWIMNLFVVWLLTGIWHGANWTFVIWGLFYFIILLLEKLTGFEKKAGVFRHLYTLVIIVIAWVFFRAVDVSAAFTYLGHMFGIDALCFADSTFWTYLKGILPVFIIALIGATPLASRLFTKLRKVNCIWVEQIWLILIFAASVVQVISSTYNPFIYFNF